MTTFGKGLRAGTRRKLAAPKRKKFKVEPLLQEFKAGERVVIKHDPSSQRGMPHIRFRGKVAVVSSKRRWTWAIVIPIFSGDMGSLTVLIWVMSNLLSLSPYLFFKFTQGQYPPHTTAHVF